MLFKWNNDLVVRAENGHGFLKLNFFWEGRLLIFQQPPQDFDMGTANFNIVSNTHCKIFKIYLHSWKLWSGKCSCDLCFLPFLFSKLLSKPMQIFCNDMLQPNSNYEQHQTFCLSHQHMGELCEIFPLYIVWSWVSYQIFKKKGWVKGGALDSISIFRAGLLGKRGVTFFRGLQFLHKK